MNKTISFLLVFAPLLGFSQWNFHHYIEIIPVNWNCTIDFGNSVFVSADTGYYCYSEYCSPSSTSSHLRRTINACGSWQNVAGESGMGYSAYAVKYFPPNVYFIHNQQGCLTIQYTTTGSNFQTLLFWGGHWYQDFYANSLNDYKLVLSDGDFAHYLNSELVLHQSFTDFKLVKLHFPSDTVGFFIAKLPSAQINSLIVKYTPSTGFNIVYQNSLLSFTCFDFTSDNIGFVTATGGTILRTDDMGDTWYFLNSGIITHLNSIDFVDDSTGYAAGIAGKILKTEDKGITWVQQTCPNASYDNIAFIDDNLGFAHAGRSIYKTTNGGVTWIPTGLKEEQSIITPNPNNGIFTIRLPEPVNYQDTYDLHIFDCRGKCVLVHSIGSHHGDIPLNLSQNPAGVYYVEIRNKANYSFATRLVKW